MTHLRKETAATDGFAIFDRLPHGFGRSGHWGEWYGGGLERVKRMDASPQKSPKFYDICRIIPNALTSLCRNRNENDTHALLLAAASHG
jgi:hypothetical protein